MDEKKVLGVFRLERIIDNRFKLFEYIHKFNNTWKNNLISCRRIVGINLSWSFNINTKKTQNKNSENFKK